MKRIRYDGPGHILNVGPHTIHRGETGEVSNADADALEADPLYDVTIVDHQPEADDGEGPPDTSEEE